MKRRVFLKSSSKAGLAFSFLGTYACKETKKKEDEATEEMTNNIDIENIEPFFKLSLAQWSIHKMIQEKGADPYSFAEKAKNWGFSGLEYVSQLYNPELSGANFSEVAMANFVEKSNTEAKKHGLENVLIMIDEQGNLAASDEAERNETVDKHKKWVDAAAAMGCHAIRVNLNGSMVSDEWKASAIDGLTKLCGYAKTKNINVLVENHGGLSSNGSLHAEVMKAVDMDNCGTLPDFGNFCITKNEDDSCKESYDRYKGIRELMPYAKAVSAKSHDFDADGNETEIDYVKMLQIVKDSGYTGYIGVEYEGDILSEEEGIEATKQLLLKASKKLS